MKSLPTKKWKIGDCYIDCGYIPRVVVQVEYGTKYAKKAFPKISPNNHHLFPRVLEQSGIVGKSLIDGTVGSCSIRYCCPKRVSRGIAKRWAKSGPLNDDLKKHLKEFYSGEWGNGRKIWWKE